MWILTPSDVDRNKLMADCSADTFGRRHGTSYEGFLSPTPLQRLPPLAGAPRLRPPPFVCFWLRSHALGLPLLLGCGPRRLEFPLAGPRMDFTDLCAAGRLWELADPHGSSYSRHPLDYLGIFLQDLYEWLTVSMIGRRRVWYRPLR